MGSRLDLLAGDIDKRSRIATNEHRAGNNEWGRSSMHPMLGTQVSLGWLANKNR